MEFESTRRRFMQLAGTGATVSLAGCNALQGIGSDGADSSSTVQTTEADDATVTVGIEPDQQQLQEVQQEIQSELQAGNITQAEAQEQYRTAQSDLIADAIENFEQRANSDFDLTIDDAVRDVGALLVSGPPADLVGTLSFDGVTGLFPVATFERVKSQSQTATETPAS